MVSLLLPLVSAAFANGQTTHVWITREAVDQLPLTELGALVSDPAYEPMLIHGTMFPDGGYPLDHPYGEAAHWEPFQMAYLEWIRDNYREPWSDEAKAHIAFLLGLASHGMADQVFDAFYLDRSRHEDAEHGWAEGESLDEATDVIWASIYGAGVVPERWLPDDVLVELFANQNIQVDTDTLHDGQNLLEAAIDLVGWMAQNGTAVDIYRASFPWGGNHLNDETLPGIPTYAATVVARYWQTLWDRLHGNTVMQEVLATHPEHDASTHPIESDKPESRVSVVFGQRLDADQLDAQYFDVQAGIGRPVGIDPWLYYGTNSHVLHLTPKFDFPENRTLLVTLSDALESVEGASLVEPYFFSFQTAGAATEPEEACGCSSKSTPWGLPTPLLLALLVVRRRSTHHKNIQGVLTSVRPSSPRKPL